MRTQIEIRQRFDQLTGSSADPLGWRREALIEAMEYDTVKDLLEQPVTWQPPEVAKAAREYLVFAIGKAVEHRGLSASRSVEKLNEWLWVLQEDTLLARFEEADYPQYGAPKLMLLANAWRIGPDQYADDHTWQRMARGLPCEDECMAGCSRG